MFIEYDKEDEYLRIVNRKPVDSTMHVMQNDPSDIDKLRREEYIKLAELFKQKETYTHDQMDADPDFSHKRSSGSCYIDDIQGIIFGGFNARFWMLRKHFISLSLTELNKPLSLYNWQCLTL